MCSTDLCGPCPTGGHLVRAAPRLLRGRQREQRGAAAVHLRAVAAAQVPGRAAGHRRHAAPVGRGQGGAEAGAGGDQRRVPALLMEGWTAQLGVIRERRMTRRVLLFLRAGMLSACPLVYYYRVVTCHESFGVLRLPASHTDCLICVIGLILADGQHCLIARSQHSHAATPIMWKTHTHSQSTHEVLRNSDGAAVIQLFTCVRTGSGEPVTVAQLHSLQARPHETPTLPHTLFSLHPDPLSRHDRESWSQGVPTGRMLRRAARGARQVRGIPAGRAPRRVAGPVRRV